MTLPTPPLTGSEEIDTALSYVADTGRTATWVMTADFTLSGGVYYQNITTTSVNGDQAGSCRLGPSLGIAGGANVPWSNPEVIVYLGASATSAPYTITIQLGTLSPTYKQAIYQYGNFGSGNAYQLHDSDTNTGSTPTLDGTWETPVNYGNWDMSFQTPPTYYSGSPVLASASPIDPAIPLISSPAVGLLFSITGPAGFSASGSIADTATVLATYSGSTTASPPSTGGTNNWNPAFAPYGNAVTHGGLLVQDFTGSLSPHSAPTSSSINTGISHSYTNDLDIVQVSTTVTITLSVKEQFVSNGRHAGTYQWVPTHVNITDGSSLLDVDVPSASQTAIDSTMIAEMEANWSGINTSNYGGYNLWGYTPTWGTTFANWHLSGTNAGTDFAAIGGTLPLTSVLQAALSGGSPGGLTAGYKGVLNARSASISVDLTDTQSPISSTSGNPGYNKYVAQGSGVNTGSVSLNGFVLIACTPPVGQTISFTELWWDGSSYVRKSGDSAAMAIAAGIAAYAAQFSGWGTAMVGVGTLGVSVGPSGYSSVPPYPLTTSVTFKPQSILSSAYNAQYNNFAKWYIYCGTDPWETANIGRKLGTLNLSVGSLPDLSSVSLSVASDAMGGSNTDTDTADLGNWAAARYLQMAVTGTLTAGAAKLTITTAGGSSADYTLRIASGAATVDLACPDSTSAFSFGVGVGLALPVPAYVSTGATGPPWYSRTTTDVPTPAANSHVASIELTLSAPSQTLTVDTLALVTAIGYDAWTDPKGDGQGYAYEIAQVIAHHVPVHVPWFGHLDALVDGKLALRYPNYGSLPNVSGYHDYNSGYQDHWDIATMLDDLIYDLGVLATGLTATWTQTFTPPGASIALSSRNIPVGLVTAPDVPLGQDDTYNTWASGATTLDIRRELTQITTPPFCCVYHLEGRWLHGGGLEGIAVDYATRQRLASASLSITHDPAVLYQDPVTGYPPIVTHASNAPTGTVAVPTDANGFFRSVPPGSYEHYETPVVLRQVNGPLPTPPNEPLIYDGGGHLRSGAIGELTYNHVVLLITTMIPRVSSLAPRDGSFHVAGTRFVSGAPAGIAYWRCDTGCPRPGVTWDSTAVVITSNILDGNACLAQDYRGRLYCQFERSGDGIYETFSDDDGQTWSAPTMSGIANGIYPWIRDGHDGSLYRAAYVDDGTGMGTGTIMGQWQAPGDPSPSTPVTFKDATGTAIPAQLGSFALTHIAESAGRWILTVLKPGDTVASNYVSADDAGGTFVLVT